MLIKIKKKTTNKQTHPTYTHRNNVDDFKSYLIAETLEIKEIFINIDFE